MDGGPRAGTCGANFGVDGLKLIFYAREYDINLDGRI